MKSDCTLGDAPWRLDAGTCDSMVAVFFLGPLTFICFHPSIYFSPAFVCAFTHYHRQHVSFSGRSLFFFVTHYLMLWSRRIAVAAVAVWCSVLQRVAVCVSLRYWGILCIFCRFALYLALLTQWGAECCRVLQSVAECCRVLQSVSRYGVATVSRIDKIIGLFCRILSLL